MPRHGGATIRESKAQRRRRWLRLMRAAAVVPPKPRRVRPKVERQDDAET